MDWHGEFLELSKLYQILRRALVFYASDASWTEKHPELGDTAIELDRGQRAKKALEEVNVR